MYHKKSLEMEKKLQHRITMSVQVHQVVHIEFK